VVSVVVVRDPLGWALPGGGREIAESIHETLARELWEEARARAIDVRFLAALRDAELDASGGVGSDLDHHAVFWARVELDPFEPEFEIVERRVIRARDAVDLLLFPHDHLFDLAALVDPLLDWKPEP
jgi:8-oxo-dGTP pyrophosphatase MutT (NUDIX family)